MIELVAVSLAALALGVLLGVLWERRASRARRKVKPHGPAFVTGPPGAREIAREAATTVEHVMQDDHRSPVLARYIADTVTQAYGRGVSDLRQAIVEAGPLPPEVLDGLCSAAMSAVERKR